MGNIKAKNSKKEWVVVATNNASGIVADNSKFVDEEGNHLSAGAVLNNHEDRLGTLERNVSWLAKHGGGGSGGSGGGPTITEATCTILANGVMSGGSVMLDNNGLTITLQDISVQATKVWRITVRIGSLQVASGSASYISPTLSVPFSTISAALTNHTGNMYISAAYEDETNGIYGSASWNGTVTESVVNLSTEDLSIGLTGDGDLESDVSINYTYSVGIVGEYTLKVDIEKDSSSVTSKTYPITTIDTNTNNYSIRVKELLTSLDIGVYTITSQLYYNSNSAVQTTIKTSLTLVSKQILISAVSMSEDQQSPVEVSLSGSVNITWTAYLQGATTFQYNYKVNSYTIKEDTIGYFGQKVNDFVSVIGKEWAIEGMTVPLTVTVKSGSDSATKTWYFKFVKSKDDFLPKSATTEGHLLSEFLARSYNNGDQAFTMTNNNYLVGGSKKTVTSQIDIFNKSNLVGIKTSATNPPYLRISNGAYATLSKIKINGSERSIADIINSSNGDFTISISFKADYHPDDQRTILVCGTVDSSTGEIITGFEIDVHDVYVNTSSQLRLTDNTINNIDIVCVHSDDDYIDSSGELKKERHYIIKIYLEGALSAVSNVATFPTMGSIIYLGGKVYGDVTDGGWLCDCNIYNLQVYDYALSDFDIVSNYINNRVATTYADGEFDFSIIDAELRKNFCERTSDGNITSYIYQNGAYTVDFLLDGTNLSEEKLNQYAKAVGIPVMLIDVSTDDSWTFENFVNQQSAENVQLQPTSGKTISYWDPTQQNISVLQVHNTTIGLQGTSTLADAVKNINITVPNDTAFIPKDTWLPEQTYTLKADVVDSSHSNNASIGKFINTVLKDYFPSDPTALDNVENSEYVKNQQPTATLKHTVEGFPILLIMNFHTTETSLVSTTPLGIYSFNLGRDAFRNLGFRKVNKITDSLGANINATTFPFLAEGCTYDETDSNANWIEIKDTTSLADFNNLTGSSLPANFDSSIGDFWQNDDTILNQRYEVRYPQGRQVSNYTTFKNFVGTVMSLPLEGLYVTKDRIGNVERPEITTEYDLYTYNNGYVKTGKKQQIITDVNQLAALGFNATSMYKYFVIANFFGLADNFGKNSTFRSWQNGDYYIGFYDMDTALGGGNQGTLSIEPNMWMKYLKNQILEGKNYGFVSETFNSEDELRLSNTVFSANHNKLWLSMDTTLMRNKVNITEVSGTSAYSYYWDDLRETLYNKAVAAGYKDTAEYFVNEFYLKQTGDCGPLLFNLDYKLKYLVQFTDDKYSNTKHLSKLHGRKAAYTLDWLKKHIIFLDSVFYWRNTAQKFNYPNDINCKMSSAVFNTPEYISIKSNSDMIVYHNVGNATQTYYYLPKNKTVCVDAGNNNSNSEVTWGITNSPQIIEIGDSDNLLAKMNIYKLSHTNTELYINNPGLTAMTELDLHDSNSLASPFGLDSFQPEVGVSEIRTLNFANTQSRLIQGSRPTFTLELVKQLAGGTTDTKFTKLREIDISNSQCVSDITIPSVPLKRLVVYNSALTNLNLDNQNYIESVDLTGCTKLITITIKECDLYKSLNIANLNNLQEVNIVNNQAITSVTINNCSNLQKVTIQNNSTLKSITITNCKKLTGSSGTNYLTITDNKVLTTLNLSNDTALTTFTISNSNQANITSLNLSNTSVKYIQGDGVDTSLLDLSKFTHGSGINVAGNQKVVEIQYANDKAKPIRITTNYQNCKALERIYGNLILAPTNGTLGEGMFRNCSNFSIHGDDYKCLGPTKWNNKNTRDENNRVKTMWELISGSADNKPSSAGGARPYASVTWDQSYVAGKKVTNIKMGNTSFNYMFYGTHVTQFDVYYMMFVIALTVTSNFSIKDTFYELYKKSGEYCLFRWNTTDNNIMNRFTFYKWNRCTSIYEAFKGEGICYILSPEEDYPIDNDEDNGVFSPLINITSLVRLISVSISFSKNLFHRTNGDYKLSLFQSQNMTKLYPEDTNYSTYGYSVSNIKVLGDFTNFFVNLTALKSISNAFALDYINFDTLQFPTSIVDISNAFRATTAGTGTIDLKIMFAGCTKLQNLYYCFATNTNASYGTQATFPITSDMFAGFPALVGVGYNPGDNQQGNINAFSFQNARHYINQDTFPEDIVANNPNIKVFSHVFYGCEDKTFSSTPKIPGNMFLNNTKLENVNSLFREANFSMTLSSNGFKNCPNLNNVGNFLRHSQQKAINSRSKVTGEIPYKFFFHGSSTATKTVYGSNQSDKPGEEFDLEQDLQESQVTSVPVKLGITDISYAFSGCINLSYYENAENQDTAENNPDYAPYKWIYNKTSKTWTENTETKEKIDYWGYNGDPTTQNASYKYLEDTSISVPTIGDIANKTQNIHYMCPPDLLRYCNANANIQGLFDYCGLDLPTQGIINSDEDYQSAGINGRIPPYLLKPVPNTSSINYMFRYCRCLSSYVKDGVIYQIPLEFFDYATGITNLTCAFQGLDFANGTNLAVFNSLKNSLDIRKIFCMCRYTKSQDGVKQTVNNVFKNNTISKITAAFAENDIQLNGDYEGSERQYWNLNNGDAVTANGNFEATKIPSSQYIMFVYFGWGTENVSDSAIPNTNNNY
jgi:hypothetical protein